uniref:BHLH domain-containing protein n=1 Tax=Heterorhabditis bacteriophora TaxID=37862 RepID=A0A1I7XE83_HETBA
MYVAYFHTCLLNNSRPRGRPRKDGSDPQPRSKEEAELRESRPRRVGTLMIDLQKIYDKVLPNEIETFHAKVKLAISCTLTIVHLLLVQNGVIRVKFLDNTVGEENNHVNSYDGERSLLHNSIENGDYEKGESNGTVSCMEIMENNSGSSDHGDASMDQCTDIMDWQHCTSYMRGNAESETAQKNLPQVLSPAEGGQKALVPLKYVSSISFGMDRNA